MITLKKVDIYKKYHGDIDAWFREGTERERSMLAQGDWSVIESIIGELSIEKSRREVQKKTAATEPITLRPMTQEEYEAATAETKRFETIVANAEYEEVLSKLWQFA